MARTVRILCPLLLRHVLAVRAVPTWARTSGHASGRIITFVCFFSMVRSTHIELEQKEVERRRRGNINEGINELGRIVPNGSGEKAKGAILSRAVQYIHHLKENEARNIEKWTLEKLLMDQAMGDLQAQLEEMRRLWEEERAARTRAESELDVLRGLKGPSIAPEGVASATDKTGDGNTAPAASTEEGDSAQGGEGEGNRPPKRQRKD